MINQAVQHQIALVWCYFFPLFIQTLVLNIKKKQCDHLLWWFGPVSQSEEDFKPVLLKTQTELHIYLFDMFWGVYNIRNYLINK